jgi:hypothetical protein
MINIFQLLAYIITCDDQIIQELFQTFREDGNGGMRHSVGMIHYKMDGRGAE